MHADIFSNRRSVAAVLAAGMLALFVLVACGGSDEGQKTQMTNDTLAQAPTATVPPTSTTTPMPEPTARAVDPTPTASPIPTPTSEPTVTQGPTLPEGIQLIDLKIGNNGGLVWDGAAAWMVGNDYGEGVRVSPHGEILLKQKMGRIPSGIATDGESIFVSDIDAGRVVRYDLEGAELGRFKIISPSWIGFADDGLWITSQGKLSRYTTDGELVFKMEAPASYAMGAERLYVVDGTALDIYATDGSIVSNVTLSQESEQIHYFDESIWMFSENNTRLTKYDIDAVEVETWTGLLGYGSMHFENGNLWIAVIREASRAQKYAVVDVIRTNLATGVTQLIIEGADNGVGAVGDDHYYYGEGGNGRVYIVDLDIEGTVVVESLIDSGSNFSGTGGFRR